MPDAVVFLGDLFDGGRVIDDLQYDDEFERYNWVFQKRLPSVRIFNVSGNHDVGAFCCSVIRPAVARIHCCYVLFRLGLGLAQYMNSGTLRRYVNHFGPLNYVVR